jgi:hypothetical protein
MISAIAALYFAGAFDLICGIRVRTNQMKKLFCLVSLGLFFNTRLASALTFHITYDSSVTTLTNAAQVEAAFAAAAQTFSDIATNAATIKITMYWGPVGPFVGGIGLGRSQFELIGAPGGRPFTYSEITNALWSHRASAADTNSVASLPATDPTGSDNWIVPLAEARVLGLFDANDPTEDGEVGFAANVNYTFDPNNRTVPGRFDFIGVAQHELSEVLGRVTVGFNDPGGNGFVPYDLFRFTNSGVRSLSMNMTTNAYFSVDNGVTQLKSFYTNASAGDIQDWKSSAIPDAFDAFSTSNHLDPMSTVDITAMDVLGYNGPRLAPPRVYETNLGGGSFRLRFVNSPGVGFTILAATNIATPLANWSVLGAPTESPSGQFQFTDTTATNTLRFYMVRSP